MKIHVVVNARAGTVLDCESESLQQEIVNAFTAAGHDVTVHMITPDELKETIAKALAQGCDAVVVGGGDGTVRAAAESLIGTGIPLGILPLGTMNRLARDLKIPLTVPQAATALAAGETATIDVGDVNGRIFLNNSIFGVTTLYSENRQSLRGKPTMQRMRGYARAVKDILQSRRRMEVDVDDGHQPIRLRILSMAVSNNRYANRPSLTLAKDGLHHGVLAVYISKHPSGWGMARAVVRAMLGRLKSDPDVVHLEGRRIDVLTRRSTLRLANDGELETVELPLRYTIRPGALKVMVPATEKRIDAEPAATVAD